MFFILITHVHIIFMKGILNLQYSPRPLFAFDDLAFS